MSFVEVFTSIILPSIATAFGGIITAFITIFLKSQYEKNKTNKKILELEHYDKVARTTVDKLVDYLNTTIVNDMKVASTDGQLTDEDVSRVSTAAKYKLYSVLGTEALTALKETYGDIDSLFDMWIASSVENAKKSKDGSGIDSAQAIGMAQARNIIDDKRQEAKKLLNDRLNSIADSAV